MWTSDCRPKQVIETFNKILNIKFWCWNPRNLKAPSQKVIYFLNIENVSFLQAFILLACCQELARVTHRYKLKTDHDTPFPNSYQFLSHQQTPHIRITAEISNISQSPNQNRLGNFQAVKFPEIPEKRKITIQKLRTDIHFDKWVQFIASIVYACYSSQ